MLVKHCQIPALIIWGLVISFLVSCQKDETNDIHLNRYNNHQVTIIDAAGSPVEGADVYLYYTQQDNRVLVSKQQTPKDGTVHFKNSYLGNYSVEVGYLNSATKKFVGDFDLSRDGDIRRQYEIPLILEVNTTSLVLLQDGKNADSANGTFELICSHAWELTMAQEEQWLSPSISSGQRGAFRVDLTAAELAGLGRGAIFNVMPLGVEDVEHPKIYVEQIGLPYFEDNLDWLTPLHTQPQNGDFLNDASKTYMQGWGNDANYHGWKRYQFPSAAFATYHGFGFFKISTGSRGGGVIIPSLSSIPAAGTDNIRLSFDIARYIPSSGGRGSGTVVVEILGNGTFQDGSKSMQFQAENSVWNVFDTESATILNVDAQTQLIIRAPQVSGNHQFLLDNIRVTKAVFII